MVGPIFYMDPEFEVLLVFAKPCSSRVILIFEGGKPRAGCAKSQAIWSVETRERANSNFDGAPRGVSPQMLTCNNFSASLPRGNHG